MNRPINYEFVDIYNGITNAILATMEMEPNNKMSLKKLQILAEYMKPLFTDMQDYKKGVNVVFNGNITGINVSDLNIVEENNRMKTIGKFVNSFNNFSSYFGINTVKEITQLKSELHISNKKM